MIDYNNRIFRSVSNTDNGEVSQETVFHYTQNGNIVEAKYSGGNVIKGTLIAIADENGCLDMRYQHINVDNVIMTGKCHSVPEVLSDGRIRLRENWEWTSGDYSKGESIIEEVKK